MASQEIDVEQLSVDELLGLSVWYDIDGHKHAGLVSADNFLCMMDGAGLKIRQFTFFNMESDCLDGFIHSGNAIDVVEIVVDIYIERYILLQHRIFKGDHSVKGIGGDGVHMLVVFGNEVPSLFELLQKIRVEQMSARFLTENLISEIDRLLFNDGMIEACEKGTSKDAVRLFELDYRSIAR